MDAKDVLQEERLQESPAPDYNHLNYTVEDRSELESLPEPDLQDSRFQLVEE